MESYLIGIVAGLAFGGGAGVLKYLVLWRKIAKTDVELTTGGLYTRFGVSYVTNFIVLLVVFLLRKSLPFDFFTTILATAIGLSLAGKLVPLASLASRVKEK
ncbi:MAG: hypothetical protein PUD55_02890 [Firmicutes bacterium]|nr:hypothetical protein [Bacillota bacterium]